MDKFFAVIGKILLGSILLAVVLTAGYFIGTAKNTKEALPSLPDTPVATPIQANAKPLETPIPTQEPTSTATPEKIFTGGLDSGTSFKKYSVKASPDWSEKDEITPGVIHKKTLSKDGYTLTIYQAPMGGGGCTYDGDQEQMMAQTYKHFVPITTSANTYRRSWNDDGKATQSYTICQKGSENSYGSPTKFGGISVSAPSPASDAMLSEIDTIIASIKEQ